MLKRIEQIKLKSQLLILICISIGIVVLLQVIFLSWFASINTKNYSQFLKDTSKQLEIKAVTFSTDIKNIANIISFNDITYQFVNTQNIEDRLKLRNNMQVMIESIMLSNKSINDIIITDLGMINIGVYRRESFWALNEINRLYKNGAIQIDGPTHYLLDGHESGRPFYVCITKSFRSQETNSDFITIIIYNADDFVNIVSSIKPNDNSLFLIMDAKNHIVAANQMGIDVGWINTALVKARETSLMEEWKGDGTSLVHQSFVDNLNWRVIGITPDVEIAKDLSALKQFGILMGVIVIVLLLGFGLIINKSITAPITKMAHFMNSLGPNYSTRRLVIHNANEISLLARVMNKMLDNIDQMTTEAVASQEKLHKAELAKKHAQFSAFQSQVNPHFLYNTLDCIRSIALAREVPEIFEITTAMAKIFRYSIKENNYVGVGDEIGCIQDYFKIIQIRQSNRFTMVCEIEETILNCIIPKMILQPIVENAVFHGLEQKKGPGTISISGYAVDNRTILFEIKDDGKGMSTEVVQLLKDNITAWDMLEDTPMVLEKKSIGIINIDRRIKLLYGIHYGLSINSSKQEGTNVVITLPMEHRNRK
ncbi:cache domain-containing sensor histidine kinase [Paenibacillus agricola]|uniref:Histidine kinase n=1 Tax=Paenibacillus agricola TaxID=2716264 RepID=A0ABX0JCB9_9BACL|nr:histidine kinase [Paenibacillus agricola]NHN32884.1 histidine kinase [Paenibacillus agricola]